MTRQLLRIGVNCPYLVFNMPPVTRRQTRSQTAGSSVGVPSSDPISASPERRNRKAAIAVDSSPSPKKSRKLPLRKKDGSPALRGQSAEQSDQGRPIEKNESVVEDTTVVAGTDDESAGSFEFGGEEDIPPAKKEVQEPKELKEREKASLREAASKTTTTTQTALPKAKAIRIVFDDDGRDPAADTTATTAQQSAEDHALKAPPIVAAGKDEADEDDEDAAPETVTSRRVDLQAEKSARAAIKAAQE